MVERTRDAHVGRWNGISLTLYRLPWFGQFRAQGWAFILHTLFALTFCVACAANLFHTPSHGQSYRIQHRWLGWTAMWSGTAVVGSGYYMVLNQESQLSDTASTLFMSTGAFQVALQVGMVVAIRYYKAVWYHMMMACILFYAAALMPAVNRAPNIFHFPDSDTFTIAIMPLALVLTFFAIRYYSIQMDKSHSSGS